MAAEEENNKKNEGKGFAGLSSLVSDVDTTPPPPAPKTESAGSTTSTGRPASPAAQPQPQQPTQRQTYQEPPQPSSGSSGGKWLLGIAAVVGLLWLIGQSNKPTSSPATAYSPPAQSAAPSYSPPAQPQAPSVPSAPVALVIGYVVSLVTPYLLLMADFTDDISTFAVRVGLDGPGKRGDLRFSLRPELRFQGFWVHYLLRVMHDDLLSISKNE